MTSRLAVLLVLLPATLLGHHSLSNFDTTRAVRVKGTIVQVHQINPHSFIFLEQKGEDGRIQRWAVEGPSVRQLNRAGRQTAIPKAGDVVEVCGYEPRERTVWQIASPDHSAVSLSGRLINAELLVMPDGEVRSWGDYGVHKCFESGYTDQHSK
jgi:hypothetical protein